MKLNNFSTNSLTLNKNNSQRQNFGASSKSKYFKPVLDVYDSFTDSMAKGMVKACDNKYVEKYIKWAAKSDRMLAHYTALETVILSGFYIQQTLKNKNLDEKKRKTLAINQAATCIGSGILAYSVDRAVNSKISEITNKYLAVNVKTASEKSLNNWKAGFSAAKTIMIFGLIYRFVTPVFVTPIANWLGNKLEEKKQAQKANALKLNA